MSLTSVAEIVAAKTVGSSEVAGVIGISPWVDRWQIYARARGLIGPQEETQEMRWGKMVQQPLAARFTQDTGIAHEWSDHAYVHPERRYQRASVDAFLPSRAHPKAILEVKTTGLHLAGEWESTYGEIGGPEGIPDYYLAQVQWQLDAHGLPLAYVAVSIAGPDVRYYKIPYDKEIADFLRLMVEPFWLESLVGDVEPAPGVSDEVKSYLKRRYPKEKEKIRPATDAEVLLLDEYARVYAELKPKLDRKEELEVELTKAIGDAEGLDWPRGKFTWKLARGSADWKALALAELDRYPQDVREKMIAALTKPGSRRIHFSPWRRKAA